MGTEIDRQRIISALPVPALVVAADGTLLFVNPKGEELIGRASDEIVGTNIADWLHPDDLTEAFVGLEWSSGFTTTTTGPMRMRHVDPRGEWVPGEVWGRNLIDDPNIGGLVVVVTEPSARFALSDAITEIAKGEPIERTLSVLSQAVEWRPFWDHGLFVVPDGDDFTTISHREFRSDLTPAGGHHGPWVDAFATGQPVRITREALPAEMQPAAEAEHYTAVWAQPVLSSDGDTVLAVLVVWRLRPVEPSPNHVAHLEQIASTASLAFTKQAMDEMRERAAVTDSLTGIANRAGFYRALAEHDASSERALMYVDLDGFKAVNDSLGHHAGDQVLMAVASRLSEAVRGGDVVSRLGGDEFAVVCLGISDPEDAGKLAQHLIDVVSAPVTTDAGDARVGASIGIALQAPVLIGDQLVEIADAALYEAKRSGKGTWRIGADPRIG